MPELPEVETVRRTLAPRVVGRRILTVTVRESRLRRPLPPSFASDLTGRCIRDIRRLGKYLLFDLDDARVWIVHLGMSGCLATSTDPGSSHAKHTHVDIELSGGTTLRYSDPRRFGLMEVVSADLPPRIAGLGPDPLSSDFSCEFLRTQTRGRRKPIKNLLMDQQVVSGIGNIYANEILFRAGVRPSRAAHRLSRREVSAIHQATPIVLGEAIAQGGSSISDYRDGEGQLGYFQLHLDVYDRAGETCRRCGTVIRSRVLAGRNSFYCPRCQR